MSTLKEQEAVLRRALLAAAEQVDPAPDGFERIQRRLRRPRPLPIAWIEAMWTDLLLNAPDFVHKLCWQVSRGFRAVVDRFGPVTGEHALGPKWTGWLRPVAAMSVAVFVIAAGAYAAMGGGAALFAPASSHGSPTGTNSGPSKGNPSGLGTPAVGSSSHVPSSGPSSSPSSGTNCKTSPPTRQLSPPPASSPATSPSTTPSDSPSPSASVTPSPTDTTSGTGSDDSSAPSTETTNRLDANAVTTSLLYNTGSELSSSDSRCPSPSTSAGSTGKKNSGKSADPDSASSARLANAQLATDETPARRSAAEAL